ncbi:MAG: efflux RND transporter permease subunit, partial [Muribaculaceae bacterium]|nr:efflux RND transporter permease subunit [Muribaculaceae bacterium]
LVFIPVSFMPGTAGVFYRQFGLTMAIAIAFSAINALTLSPALCAVFLKAHDDKPLGERVSTAMGAAAEVVKKKYAGNFGLNFPPVVTLVLLIATIYFMIVHWFSLHNIIHLVIACVVALLTILGLFGKRFHRAFENGYGKLLAGYKKGVRFFAGHKLISFGTVAGAIVVLAWLMTRTPSAMVPNEDTGFLFGMVDMPAGTSQERTTEVLNQLEDIVMQIPAVRLCESINGYSFLAGQGATYGTLLIKLKNWSERGKGEGVDDVIRQLYGMTQNVKDGRVVFFAPPMITGYSVTNGFELKMQDKTGGDINQFFAVVQAFLAQLNAQPEIQSAYTTFNPSFPQYMIDIDAAKAKQAG